MCSVSTKCTANICVLHIGTTSATAGQAHPDTILRFVRSTVIGRKHKPHRRNGADTFKPRRDKGRTGIGRFFNMGQDGSSPVDGSLPPQTLESRTLEGLAKYIKDGRAKRIVVMVGRSSANLKARRD